jgi:hypothetical protein
MVMKYPSTLLSLLLFTALVDAADFDSAQVSVVVNEVKLFPESGAAKAASAGDTVSGSTSLQTGRRSRAELTFPDATITRVGANSVFSFKPGTRELNLEQGTMLLQMPKGAGETKIRTATVTAAITGTTVLMEVVPGVFLKFIVLEGSGKIKINGKVFGGKKVNGGEAVFFPLDGSDIPDPVGIDVKTILETCLLLEKGGFPQLSPAARQMIADVIARQGAAQPTPSTNPESPDNSIPVPRNRKTFRDVIQSIFPPRHDEGHPPYHPPEPPPQPPEGERPPPQRPRPGHNGHPFPVPGRGKPAPTPVINVPIPPTDGGVPPGTPRPLLGEPRFPSNLSGNPPSPSVVPEPQPRPGRAPSPLLPTPLHAEPGFPGKAPGNPPLPPIIPEPQPRPEVTSAPLLPTPALPEPRFPGKSPGKPPLPPVIPEPQPRPEVLPSPVLPPPVPPEPIFPGPLPSPVGE